MFKRILAVLGFSLYALHSQAATLIVEGGQLMGATGVDVGGSLYDVNFVDGTCIDLFDGCDSNSDFIFQSEALAILASQALLDQVFVDSAVGQFDSTASLTNGIESHQGAFAMTPYQLSTTPHRFHQQAAINYSVGNGTDYISGTEPTINGDVSHIGEGTYAVWKVTPVPIPAAGWLFMSALLGLVGLQRKARR